MRGRKAVFYLFVFLLVSSLSYAFNLELNSGWNLISIPVNISNKTASWLCDQVNCSSILAYNNGWISYSPNRAMNSLENINETIGIWVYTNKSDSVVVDGQLANTPIQHYSGWNLVGYPSLISRAVEEVYNMSKVEAIFMFNNTWKNVSELNPGYGYWIKALEDFTLVINNAPVIDLITILPDDSVDAGVQVMPNAGNVTEVRINVEVSDIDGVDDIALVEALTPKGLINLNKVGNIDSDTGNYSSVFYMNYSDIARRIVINGEPGLIWLENAHNNKRMGDIDDGDIKDNKTKISNPCGEVLLEGNGELCNLIELFLNRSESKEDFMRSIKFAYLYAKTVTLLETHWPQTNRIILRNRRIGTSISGVVQFLSKYNLAILKEWLNDGYVALKEYDKIYSDWFAIPRSIRLSTQKPSGSISLLAGATPGIHYPESNFYIRRVRLSKNSNLIELLKKSNYNIEDAFGQEDSTVIVEIPVSMGNKIKTVKDVTLWEQLSLAAFIQKEWADNSVSVTISFDPDKEGDDIESAINYYQYQLKTVSFLPRKKDGAYKQMPYEAIDEETYNKMIKKLKPIDFTNIKDESADVEKYCDGESCILN